MSIFSEEPNSGETTSFLEKLVETKGEQWKDPETIAKGKLEADAHIAQLEAQLAGMREDMAKQEYAKELLAKLEGTEGQTSQASSSTQTSATSENTTSETVDLDKLLEEKLAAREAASKAEGNSKRVEEGLVKAFGTEARTVVQNKAKELNMSLSQLEGLAKESPDAFLRLVGADTAKKTPSITPTSNFNITPNENTTSRSWSDLQELRKTKPSEYWSPAVQNEIMRLQEEAKRSGGSFVPS